MIQRKKIVIVGSNGTIGKEMVKHLIKKYELYCIIRSPSTFAINSIFLRFIEGDALDRQTLEIALEGKDAVVSCFGIREGESEERLVEYTKLLADVMQKQNVKRLITVNQLGAFLQEGTENYIFNNQNYEFKNHGKFELECVTHLKSTLLDYTIIGLSKIIVSDEQGNLNVYEKARLNLHHTGTKKLADFIAHEIQVAQNIKKLICLQNA